jgi:YD repeat-containing protein
MKCRILLALMGITFCTGLRAQIDNRTTITTPNAAGLGLYGQIPVDYFSGLPTIDIPVYEFKSRNLSVPLHLSYHAAGIRPADHASWVGLGWSLQAGGVINRIQNDLPDELFDFTSGTGVGFPRGFFYNSTYLAPSNWSSGSSLLTADSISAFCIVNPNFGSAHIRPDYAPDEFQFSFLGMSGSLLMGTDGQWHLKSKQGLNFTVQTEIGPYSLLEPISHAITGINHPSLVRNCLTKFILTGSDGTRYSFGTDPASNMDGFVTDPSHQYFATPDSNAVEFTRVGSGYSNSGASCRDGGTVPTSWYLTKINSPTGDSITFSYTRDGYQLIASTVAFGSYSQCSTCNPFSARTYGAGDNVTILDGVTLSGISGASGSVQFNKSRANVMDITYLGAIGSPNDNNWNLGDASGLFPAYSPEIFQLESTTNNLASTFMQLDSIVVKDFTGARVRGFKFAYTSSPYNRLFLNSFQPVSTDNSVLPPYNFTYNNSNGLYKVPYNTLSVDHWGYYTGKNSFSGLFTGQVPTDINPFYSTGNAIYVTDNSSGKDISSSFDGAFNATYSANRSPVPDSMAYGILTQITYPTGGYSQFTWEPNTYSKYIKTYGTDSVTVPDLHTNSIGAGLRIKKISSQANFNSPVLSKSYLYYRDYIHHDTLSSGVLNSALPQYVDSSFQSGSFTSRIWSSANALPTYYTDGSPVTYTQVTEINADNGQTVYTYANHDNGYQDKPPANAAVIHYTNTGTLWQQVNTCSMELERGLPLNQAFYKADGTLLRNVGYQYNNDPSRLTTPVRKLHYDRRFSLNGAVIGFDAGGFVTLTSGIPIYFGDFISAINTYVQFPYSKTVTETDYDQSGGNPQTKVTSYTYDTYRNRKSEAFVSSSGETVLNSYNYPTDVISGLSAAASYAQSKMLAGNMVALQLEKTRTVQGVQTDHTRQDYQVYPVGDSLIVPATSYQASYGAVIDTAVRYANYDSLGNITEYVSRDGIATCVDWGYNSNYPVVKVENGVNTYHSYSVSNYSTGSTTANWVAGNFANQTLTFTLPVAGTIKLAPAFASYPSNYVYTFNYNLVGPATQQGLLCICGSGGTCSGTPSSATFPNMPAGTYSVQLYPISNYQIGTSFTVTYPNITYPNMTAGSKNYFYAGFEEMPSASVITGIAHTGTKCWNTNYTTAFTPPDARAYTIEYWSYSGGSWMYHNSPYVSGMVLTGPVDDIRIFPDHSLMSTYTYQPMVGMTSQINPQGITSYYSYDGLGRLSTIKDKDGNVIKRYCYNFDGQAENCQLQQPATPQGVTASNSSRDTIIATFTNTVTSAVQTFKIPPSSTNVLIGAVPTGNYNVVLGPQTLDINYTLIYTFIGNVQTSYDNVLYGGGTLLSSPVSISVAPSPVVSVVAGNYTNVAATLEFQSIATGVNYYFTSSPTGLGTATLGSLAVGNYNVFMGPVSPSPGYPITYNYNGQTQTYYGTVTLANQAINSTVSISLTPLPSQTITVQNLTTTFVAVICTNTSTNVTYNFTAPPSSNGSVGTVPPGTYNVTLSPLVYSSSKPIYYQLYTYSQTYYAAVEFGNVIINTTCPIIMHY